MFDVGCWMLVIRGEKFGDGDFGGWEGVVKKKPQAFGACGLLYNPLEGIIQE